MENISVKILLFSISLSSFLAVCSQPPASVIAGHEKAFADYSAKHSTQEAFVKFFSDSCIVFEQGKIINGMNAWKQRQADSSLLYWYPVITGISASRDFGYTSGPWHFRNNRDSSSVNFMGYFNSVWKKESDGQWRVVIDNGISHEKGEQEEDRVLYSSIATDGDISGRKYSAEDILKIEQSFINSYTKNNLRSSVLSFSTEARVFRKGSRPFSGNDAIKKLLSQEIKTNKYLPVGGDIASSGDLGYAYGYVKGQEKDQTYMRVWKKEKGKGWKIVIDVLTGE